MCFIDWWLFVDLVVPSYRLQHVDVASFLYIPDFLPKFVCSFHTHSQIEEGIEFSERAISCDGSTEMKARSYQALGTGYSLLANEGKFSVGFWTLTQTLPLLTKSFRNPFKFSRIQYDQSCKALWDELQHWPHTVQYQQHTNHIQYRPPTDHIPTAYSTNHIILNTNIQHVHATCSTERWQTILNSC